MQKQDARAVKAVYQFEYSLQAPKLSGKSGAMSSPSSRSRIAQKIMGEGKWGLIIQRLFQHNICETVYGVIMWQVQSDQKAMVRSVYS